MWIVLCSYESKVSKYPHFFFSLEQWPLWTVINLGKFILFKKFLWSVVLNSELLVFLLGVYRKHISAHNYCFSSRKNILSHFPLDCKFKFHSIVNLKQTHICQGCRDGSVFKIVCCSWTGLNPVVSNLVSLTACNSSSSGI